MTRDIIILIIIIIMRNIGKRTVRKETSRVCVQVHFNMCMKIGLTLDNEHKYDHVSTEISRNRSRR